MSLTRRPGNRQQRRAEDKALLCLERRTKIPLSVRSKIPPRRLVVAAAKRDLKIDPLGHPHPITAEEKAKLMGGDGLVLATALAELASVEA